MLPCPKCGSTDTNGTFCTPCLRKLHPLVKRIKPVKLTCCSASRRIRLHGTWKPFEEAVTQAIGQSLITDGSVSAIEAATPELVWKPGIKRTTETQAIITGKNEDALTEYTEAYTIPLQYEMTVSPAFRKQASSYYEGVLQARNETPETQAMVRAYVREHGVHITRVQPLPNGTDYYLSSHRAVGHLARMLHKEFGGEVKIAAQHFSRDRQRSKTLYRTNALISFPEYGKGDVILRNDEYLVVERVGARTTARNLMTGERETFSYASGEAQVLPTSETTVTSTEPAEVLHPVTFQPSTLENPSPVRIDERVLVAMDGTRVFLIRREGRGR